MKPIVYVLIGLPGSGKSTFALEKMQKEQYVHLSSDLMRLKMYGDESFQGNNAKVFARLNAELREAILQGKSVIYDATNLNRRRRINLLRDFRAKIRVHYVLFATPFSECIERNNKRQRKVPIDVIERMRGSFQMPLDDEYDELQIVYAQSEERIDSILRSMIGFNQHNPHHSLNLFDHCSEAVNCAYLKGYSLEVRRAALFHDCGKVLTQSFDAEGIAHYYNHASVSAYDCLCAIKLEMDRASWIRVFQLICYHMYPYDPNWKNTFPQTFYDELMQLHECDLAAH